MHGLRQKYHRLRYHLGRTQWCSEVRRIKWRFVSVHLEIVLILTLDRCTICNERTIGSEIILDEPNVHLGDEAQLVARFSPFGDRVILMQDRCMVCTERTIGSRIIYDAPYGTPR